MATMDYEQENGRYDSMLIPNRSLSSFTFIIFYTVMRLMVDRAPQMMSHATNVTEALHLAQSVTMTTP